jgi:hypothetical protein
LPRAMRVPQSNRPPGHAVAADWARRGAPGVGS